MRKRHSHSPAQLVLDLEPRTHRVLLDRDTKGLVEALADLLLEALGTEAMTSTRQGGGDERQDHA